MVAGPVAQINSSFHRLCVFIFYIYIASILQKIDTLKLLAGFIFYVFYRKKY